MRAKNKVGRPKVSKPKVDMGTIELRRKRKQSETVEALDLALSRDFITQEGHDACLRLRWLYCLQFGAPNVSAYDFDGKFGGASVASRHDELWQKARAAEYFNAMELLEKLHVKQVVSWVVIFDKRPLFLRYRMRELVSHPLFYNKAERELASFKDGVEALSDFFGKKEKAAIKDSKPHL